VAVAGKSANGNPAAINAASHGSFRLVYYPTPRPSFADPAFDPPRASPGNSVRIHGIDFSGATNVLFNGVPAQFAGPEDLERRDRELLATVPFGATTGPIRIETPHGSSDTSSSFEVLPPSLRAELAQPGVLRVSWVGEIPGAVVETNAALEPGGWEPLPHVPASGNGMSWVDLPLTADRRWFRLKLE
jgi:hypothetical protein